ncbi:MAG TPA: GDP-L-fucose synthase [Patescibacteria group bacterium]|nr:GDP-L-fucose synthase [Patescibacteria group bacterium]
MTRSVDLTKKTILVTGAAGFLGTHLLRLLRKQGVRKILAPLSKEYDLRKQESCKAVVRGVDIVIHLASKVGGIGYNRSHPAEMFYDNIIMSTQLLHEAYRAGVEKFVGIGTICAYPKFTPVPFLETELWNGYPEETNAPYGLAKKMLLVQSQTYRQQYGFNAIYLLPVNLYGPGDNFDPKSSHVIPALIRKFSDAKEHHAKEVVIWGSGKATREFLYVEDAARAIILATERYNKPDPVNVGAGFEISIADLAGRIAKRIGFGGKVVWDTSKPDGQPRRCLDTTRAKSEFQFVATTPFDMGLKREIDWYKKSLAKH